MNCLNIAELIDERDSSRLTAAERREVEAHLDACPECRAAFVAHEAMLGMLIPAMSPGLADRCRQLIAAQSGGRARRAGGRPFVVVGLLLAGVAAAAFVGLSFVGGSDAGSDLTADSVLAEELLPVAGESSAVLLADTVTDATATEAAADIAAKANGFTVAVTFRQLSDNLEVIRASETVYRAFLEELRSIPDLDLIELDPADPTLAGLEPNGFGLTSRTVSPAVVNFSDVTEFSGAEFSVSTAERVTTIEGGRTIVIVDSRTVTATGPGSEGVVDMSMIPTALVGTVETVTGSASASFDSEAAAGVVNVILDNNIQGVRVDLSAGMTVSSMHVESPPYDFVLRVTSSDAVGRNSWTFSVMANSRQQGANFSAGFESQIGEPVVPEEFLEPLIASLQDQLLPVDQAKLTEIEQRVIDTRLPIDERLRELGRLTRMNERSGNAILADNVALAIVDIASRVTDDSQRLSLWRMLKSVDNPVLVQPLTNALRNDANEALRLEVAHILANFQQDPVVRAALEAAANSDPSPVVRQNARWASLDATGQRNLVVASLLDTRLSDAERIEPLLFDLSWARIEPVELGLAIDATVANELAALLRRHEQAMTRARVLSRLELEVSPALAPLFAERLAEDEADVVRTTAASALSRRLDEPGVRSALERAAANDPSPVVRSMSASALATGN